MGAVMNKIRGAAGRAIRGDGTTEAEWNGWPGLARLLSLIHI